MVFLDTRKFLFSSKNIEVTPCTYKWCCFNMCKKTIILFSRVWKFIVSYYNHYDVIKHQTTGHNTYRIIFTEILIFHWIHNMVIFQGDIFDGGKNSLPSGGNVFDLFFRLEWRQTSNYNNSSLMDIHWYLNPYIKSCGSFIVTNAPIIWE